MADENINKNKEDEEGGGSTETGTGTSTGTGGGAAGEVEFRDFLVPGERLRDDVLPVDEKRRLIAVHQTNHEWKVKKQKDLMTRRKEVRQGKITLAEYRQGRGYGAGMNGLTKTHPLSQTAQFGSGAIDNNVNNVPDQYESKTNDENRLELEYQYKLENKLVQTYAHDYTPKLTRK